MRNCDFPQNVIELLDLKFENGIKPYDFASTLAYLIYENPSRDGVMFLQYYTTEATYEEIAATYGVAKQTARQAITKVARRLNSLFHTRRLTKGIHEFVKDSCKKEGEKLREKNKDKIENTERLVKEARNKALKEGAKQGYDKGFDDGYKACRRHYWEEDEPAPTDAAEDSASQTSQFSLKDEFSPNDMSTRVFNCLRRAGLFTIGDILTKTPEELMRVRNLGRKAYNELVDYLVEHCGERREDWEPKDGV